MLSFLRWILKHPVSVLLSVLLIVLIGILSLINIPIEIKPDQSGQGIRIVAYWKKHPPEAVQRSLTQPLEDVAIQLKDIITVESSSGIGMSIIQLKFPKKSELKYAYIELQEHLSILRDDLPQDAVLRVEPLFNDDEAEQTFKQSFFDLELIGPLSLNELSRIAKDKIIPKLNSVDGIGYIELYGGSDGFIRIDVNDDLLKTFEIEPEILHQQLKKFSINKGLGIIQDKGQRQLLILDNRPQLINDFNHIPIHDGLTLSDVSQISFAYEKPVSLSRHNFNPLVLIRLFKAPGVNAITFAASLKDQIKKIEGQLSGKTHIRIASDSSKELREELNSLAFRSLVILCVVFMILFVLFQRWMLSMIILLVVFLSIISASIFLYWSGYTINVVTLAGLALVFGMLVDNAVVVIENIQRYRSEGRSEFGSGMRGTLEVFQPLLASTGTTVLVFLALLLLEDRLGAYYKPLAFVLGFTLVMSLLIAVILIPAIIIRWPNLLNGNIHTRWRTKGIRWYSSFLQFVISRRKSTLVFVMVLFTVSGYLFWKNIEKGGFFYWGDKEILRVYVDAPKGVTLEVLDEIIRNFEDIIQNQNVDCSTQTIVDESDGYGYLKITFPDSVINSVTPYVMKEYLITEAVNYAGVGIGIYGFGMPYWNGGYKVRTMYNTTLQITGPDYYRLWEIGESILDLAKMDVRVNEGIISPSIRSLYQSDLKEYRFTADVKQIWNNRFSISSVMAGAQKVFLNQSQQGEIFLGDKRYPVQIHYGEDVPELESLNHELIQIKKDRVIPVSDYFSFSKEAIQPWIDKKNQQYRFTIAWQYRGPERMRSNHEKIVVNSLNLPPGYTLEEKWWSFLTQKEESDLLLLFSIVAVGTFMILAALYESFSQPFIIFLSVPFALVGVFLSYVIFERNFNVNGYIGLILLFGIVLNNGIILVERINQLYRKGGSLTRTKPKPKKLKAETTNSPTRNKYFLPKKASPQDPLENSILSDLRYAVVQGGVERIRPILITTLTTVGGLIPLLFLSSGNTAMATILEELSFITVWGLVGSTTLTITLIPVFYYMIEKVRLKIT